MPTFLSNWKSLGDVFFCLWIIILKLMKGVNWSTYRSETRAKARYDERRGHERICKFFILFSTKLSSFLLFHQQRKLLSGGETSCETNLRHVMQHRVREVLVRLLLGRKTAPIKGRSLHQLFIRSVRLVAARHSRKCILMQADEHEVFCHTSRITPLFWHSVTEADGPAHVHWFPLPKLPFIVGYRLS